MIRPLRQHHRHVVIAFGLFVPIAFAVGIAARKPPPEMDALPKEILPAATSSAPEAWFRADLFPKSSVQVRLLREQSGEATFALTFTAARDFVKPDLLVYWVAANSTITDTLPDGAILLGTFTSPQLPLPPTATESESRLLLFSVADNQIVDASKPLRFEGSTNKTTLP
jgi:hypothetical protein